MADKKKRILAAIGFLSVMLLAGCGKQGGTTPPGESTNEGDTGFVLAGPGSYDSADTAVVVKIDRTEGTITFFNTIVSKNYTLSYDGTTVFSDKYGQAISLDQLAEGDIVDVTFLKSKKRLASASLAAEGWTNAEISKYTIDARGKNVTIGEEVFKFTADTKIFSDGEEIELMELNDADILTFHGMDRTVLSIVVEKGHGYLKLTGDEKFLGGWIEVGQNIIRQITEDMLLTVPEGSYQVLISTKGGGGTKNVIINRNEEVTLDISDLEIEEPLFGQVLFVMKPSTATLYIDGNLVDTSTAVSLEYGIHQVVAKAEGYQTLTSYLKVAEPSAAIEVSLEKEDTSDEDDKKDSDKDDTDDDKKGDTVSSGDNTTTDYYKVYIDSPEGAEVYVDGNYVGIAPVSFKKVEGAHVIILRRNGFETRSYTIQVDKEDKDVTYSFVDLEEE